MFLSSSCLWGQASPVSPRAETADHPVEHDGSALNRSHCEGVQTMKLSKWAFALAIATAFWPGAAVFAQIGSGLAPQRAPGQPNQTTTYTYGDYYAAQPTEPAPAVEPVVEEFVEEEEEDPQPWRLVNQDNALG